MSKVTVLLTCVASQVIPNIISLVKDYRKSDLRIIGIDTKPLSISVGGFLCDSFYNSPMGNDSGYKNFIYDIVEKERINIIFPGSDEEVLALSDMKTKLVNDYNCEVICSPKKITLLAVDKYKMHVELNKNNIPVGKFSDLKVLNDLISFANDIGYPGNKFIFKPKIGRGSKGVKIIDGETVDKLDNFITNKQTRMALDDLIILFEQYPDKLDNFFVMEYFPGDKFSSDVLISNGDVKSIVIRNNGKQIKANPPTQIADIVINDYVKEYTEKICELMKFDYFVQIETGMGIDEKPYFIESNVRMDATLPITTGVGINFFHELIDYALNGTFNNIEVDYDNFRKIRFFRYWDHVFINSEELHKKQHIEV